MSHIVIPFVRTIKVSLLLYLKLCNSAQHHKTRFSEKTPQLIALNLRKFYLLAINEAKALDALRRKTLLSFTTTYSKLLEHKLCFCENDKAQGDYVNLSYI